MLLGRGIMLANRCILIVVLLLAAEWASAGQARVEAVRLGQQAEKTRVALDLSAPVEHKVFTLSNPNRVVIDIRASQISKQILPLPAGRGAISGLRVSNRQDGSARIVIDLTSPMKPKSFVLPAANGRRDRLVIDLSPLAWPKPAASAPVKSAVARNTGRDIVVAIDPGHGGKDPGARGRNGLREKDVVLAIGRRLAEIIDAEPGMRALMTRSSDQFVPLRSRMERARRVEADLFISIHADAFRDRSVRGATVYVLSDKGATDEAGRRLAQRENAALIGVQLDDKNDVLKQVLMDLAQHAALSSSIDVGDEILQEIGQVTRVRKHKVQQAPFLVLKSPDVPSILIETAFISNPRDEKNLGSRQYRETLAHAIFDGVHDYFQFNPPPGTRMAMMIDQRDAPAQAHYVIRRGDTLGRIADRYNVSVRRIRLANNLDNDQIVVGRVLRIPSTREI